MLICQATMIEIKQAELITPDEIEGAYEIATIHNGRTGYFLWGKTLNYY